MNARAHALGLPDPLLASDAPPILPPPDLSYTDWLHGDDAALLTRLRANTTNGWPTDSEVSVANLEQRLDRRLTRLPAGRKKAV